MVRSYCIFITILFGLLSARAQVAHSPRGDYLIETWNSESRFTPFSIHAMGQTPDGYLWIATDGGLLRFDGENFREFHPGNTASLTTDDITAMTVDREGRVWIGAWNGSIWRQEGDGFKAVYLPPDPAENAQVYELYVTGDGSLLAGTRWGVSRIVNDSLLRIPIPDSLDRECFSIAEGPDSSLWVGLGTRLVHVVGDDAVAVPASIRAQSSVLSLLPLEDGELLLGSNDGLFRVAGGRTFAVEGMGGVWVHAIHRDRNGVVWIATAEDGLFRYAGGRFERLTTDDGLPSNRITAIMEARDGTLWFGTRGGGFFRLKTPLIDVLQPVGRSSGGKISTVYGTRDGSLLIGTRDDGLSIIRGDGKSHIGTRSGLPSDFIRCTFEDSRGGLWVGTSEGTVRLARNEGRPGGWEIGPVRCEELPVWNVRSIVEDTDGTIWMGSHGNGVYRYDPGTGIVTRASGLVSEYFGLVLSLHRWSNRGILVATKGGFYTITDTGAVIERDWRAAGISEVFCVYEDADSTLWIGTYGLGLFRVRDSHITRYTVTDGLFNNVIYAIAEDDAGRLWMSCNMGIFYAGKRDLERVAAGQPGKIRCISYGTRDGMHSIECNGGSGPSVWKTGEGKVMFPTMNGVAVLDPSEVTPGRAAGPVVIENVVVDGVPAGGHGGLELSPDTKTIDFAYSSIGFDRAEDIGFQTYLEGFDEGWSDRGPRRSIRYTSLPSGEYVMHLRAKYPEAAWPERSTTLAFTVRPYLWERWPVRIAAGLLLAFTIVVLVRLRDGRIRAEAERERELRATLSELESRALRSQINPHFIFNSLNGIREAVLDGHTGVASEYIEQFSALMRNVLENSNRRAVTLEREIETLRLYVDLERRRFEEPFRFVLEVPAWLDTGSIMMPPMLIQPLVENAIWHGLGPKEGEKLLSITFSGDAACLRCAVEDNGVGRKHSAVRAGRRGRDHTPRGMQITRDLIDAFRKETGGDAGMEVVDLLDGKGAAAGTRVILTIPVQP